MSAKESQFVIEGPGVQDSKAISLILARSSYLGEVGACPHLRPNGNAKGKVYCVLG